MFACVWSRTIKQRQWFGDKTKNAIEMVLTRSHELTVLARFKRIPPQRAAVAAVLAAVLATALPVKVHGFRDLRDPLHQGAAQAFLGVALLLEVRVVGQHLLVFVDLQLGVQLLQLFLMLEGVRK